jgi:Flp pilus assembly protein TadG
MFSRSNRRKRCTNRRSVRERTARTCSSRKGIATVEFAVILPILLTLVLGSIEVCQRLFIRQSATIAAYEGIRLAARKTSTPAEVIARCNQLLSDRRITGAQINLTPSDFEGLITGSEIKLELKIPWSANTPTRFVLQDQGFVGVNAVMLRE